MKIFLKIWIKLCLFIFSGLFRGQDITIARSYPLQSIQKGNVTELPIIKQAAYTEYQHNPLYRQIYTMLRMSTYFQGRDMGAGSHQGVDIATETGTPVYASHEGIVIHAEYQKNRGNVIVIQHERQGKTYYTTYAHLSTILVSKGQNIKEGEIIGEVGETGNATGPHLHFQIETNTDNNHPFFPIGCKWTIDEIVNEGLCYQQIQQNTIDPIAFLEITTKNEITSLKKPLFIEKQDIEFSEIKTGFLETNSTIVFHIQKNEQAWEILKTPLTFTVKWQAVTITPTQIKTLTAARQGIIQTSQIPGISIIEARYNGEKIQERLILTDTKEMIQKWKENQNFCNLLQQIQIEC